MTDRHPCFNSGAHGRFGRIHLPVAARCNISCGFCDRRYACVNESRPGVTAQLLSPEEACALTIRAAASMPELAVAGIAGPGDPLANPSETFKTLRLVRKALPHLLLCLSSNGLALPDAADEIAALGVGHMTVTVNAVDPSIGARIYRNIQGPDGPLSGEEGARLLLERQERGIRSLRERGLTVKVNTVVVPEINDFHIAAIAERVADWGAALMNCIPLIPVPGTPLGAYPEPGHDRMARVRAQAEAFLPQMRHCARCRADALGLLGADGVIGDMRVPGDRRDTGQADVPGAPPHLSA